MPNLWTVGGSTTGSPTDLDQVVDALSGNNDVGNVQLYSPINPPGALTAAINSTAGNLNGSYQYKVAFITGYWQGPAGSGTLHTQGNTGGGTVSNTVSPSNQQINLTSIPIGGTGVVARVIYRTKAGGSTFYFLQQINDNVTTSWTDNVSDASLSTTVMPTSNTTGTSLTAPEFIATSQTAPFQMPNLTQLPATVGPAGTAVLVNNKLYTSDGTNWKAGASFGGFRNLLDPSKQSFTRASNATRKDLTSVPFNVLRTEQGRFGQGAFIEESTTEIVLNNDFETITGTAVTFSDAMTAGTTADPAWTVQGGSFTWSASGATCGANASIMSAGNSSWKPLTGSNGTALSLTAQATFTMPATVPSGYPFILRLVQDGSNDYQAIMTSGSTFALGKHVGGGYAMLSSVTQSLTASTAYTVTLSLTPSGQLTAKLYSGVGTGGTLLQTLTATDTSLTGGFLIGVGGDTGVVVKSAQVTAPFADGWTIGGDQRVAWALTSTNPISGSYSVSAVGVSGVYGFCSSNQIATSAGNTFTTSGSASGNNLGSAHAYIVQNYYNVATYLSQNTAPTSSGTFNTQRFSTTGTTPANTTIIQVAIQINDVGTAIFDAIQLEQKAYATTYVRNDSTSASATRNADSLSYTLSNPLPSRWFKAMYYTPNNGSSVLSSNIFLLQAIQDSNNYYAVKYSPSSGYFYVVKFVGGSSVTLASYSINATFNVGDRIFVALLVDPTNSQITLWLGLNNGALQSTVITDTSTTLSNINSVYVGCSNNGGQCNGTIDYPIITDILPSADQVQALYQASDWGGLRNYPNNVFPSGLSITGGLPSSTGLMISNNAPVIELQETDSGKGHFYIVTDGGWFNIRQNSLGSPNLLNINVNGVLSGQFGNILQAISGGYKVQSASSSVTVATAGTEVQQTLTFPTPFLNQPTAVIVHMTDVMNTGGYINVRAGGITKNGFTLAANSYIPQTISYSWVAVGS